MCSTELLMEYSSKLPVLFYLLFLLLIRPGFVCLFVFFCVRSLRGVLGTCYTY